MIRDFGQVLSMLTCAPSVWCPMQPMTLAAIQQETKKAKQKRWRIEQRQKRKKGRL